MLFRSQLVSSATTQQAASLEETSSSIEEMNSMVQNNSENAGHSAEESKSSRIAAESAQTNMHKMIDTMKIISASNEKIIRIRT